MSTTAAVIPADVTPSRWRTARFVIVAVAFVVLVALSFVVGRVTAGTTTPTRPVAPAVSAQTPWERCASHVPC